MSSGVLSIAKPHRMWVVCSKEDNKPFGVLSGDEHSYDKLEEFIGSTGVSAYIVPFVLDKLEKNNAHRIDLGTTNPIPFPQAEGLITEKGVDNREVVKAISINDLIKWKHDDK